MYSTNFVFSKNKYKINFNQLYLNYYVNKFYWKIDPILNTSWKLDVHNVNVTKVQDIRAARFWEKFRQGTNREQYRTGVHMIIYLNIVLFVGAYLRFNSSTINISKLSLLTVLLSVLLFFSIRKITSVHTLLSSYKRLIISLYNYK